MTPGNVSGEMSGWVSKLIGKLLPFLSPESEYGHWLVRKIAHFSEFALLGLLFCGRHRLVGNETPVHLLGFGMAVACIDETIQIFTPGRASSLIDVWIDTSGFALGLVVIYLAYTIKNKIIIKGEPTT